MTQKTEFGWWPVVRLKSPKVIEVLEMRQCLDWTVNWEVGHVVLIFIVDIQKTTDSLGALVDDPTGAPISGSDPISEYQTYKWL